MPGPVFGCRAYQCKAHPYGSELFDAIAAHEMGFADAVVESEIVESAIAFGAPNKRERAIGDRRHEAHPAGDHDRGCRRHKAEIELLIRQALDSDDYREGAAAFLKKRPARFTGR